MPTDIVETVELLYAGTLDDDAWHLAMISLADLVGAVCTCLFSFRPTDGAVLRDECHRFDPLVFSEYRKNWSGKDPRLLPTLAHDVGVPVYEARLMPVRSWKRSEIYNEFLQPAGIGWFLAVWLHKAPDKVVCLSLQRAASDQGFGEAEADALRPLISHLRRALEIKDRLEFCHVRADTLAKSLDTVSFGVLILDTRGRVLEANSPGAQLMCKENGIRQNADGTLWLREPAGSELRSWIAAGSPPAQNEQGLLHIPRTLALPISVMVVGLPADTSAWISGDPRWMLLLFDPDRKLHPMREIIARDLRISEREAQIAALLMAGHELKDVATRLHISLNTVRTHLKAIFAKTGIRSQSELMRRIAGSPAMIRR